MMLPGLEDYRYSYEGEPAERIQDPPAPQEVSQKVWQQTEERCGKTLHTWFENDITTQNLKGISYTENFPL